jgi:protein arginine kinase activator
MLCERCKEREATFFLTRVVNGEKAEYHLCQQCAAETGQLGFIMEPQFTFTNFLAGLLNTEMGFAPAKPAPTAPQCHSCGLTYDDFRQVGQFACAHCYEEFEPYLEALFRRVQGGTEHTGKAPQGAGRTGPKSDTEVREAEAKPSAGPEPLTGERPKSTVSRTERLRQELADAIAREDYERAAKLRDEIRALPEGEGK